MEGVYFCIYHEKSLAKLALRVETVDGTTQPGINTSLPLALFKILFLVIL